MQSGPKCLKLRRHFCAEKERKKKKKKRDIRRACSTAGGAANKRLTHAKLPAHSLLFPVTRFHFPPHPPTAGNLGELALIDEAGFAGSLSLAARVSARGGAANALARPSPHPHTLARLFEFFGGVSLVFFGLEVALFCHRGYPQARREGPDALGKGV
jgi:hypothetical protein